MSVALTPGGNTGLAATRITVEVAAPARLDVSALLLDATGKVRSDADFVFYNAPSSGGVTYRPASGSDADSVTVDTTAVPQAIERIVVTASVEGGTFAGIEPTAVARDAGSGTVLATFTPPGLGPETALIVVELYRRGGDWKIRAVGQGYSNGLAGIATDFGVSVAEDEPSPHASAPSISGPPTAPAKINLDKGKVSLTKGSSVSLVKGGAPLLSLVRMGLGWDAAVSRGRRIDLDASCIAYDAQRKEVGTVYFGKLTAFNGSIQHAGDNLTGKGDGDDESIAVHLGSLPPHVMGLVFVVNSYSGQKFTEVRNAYCRLLDGSSGQELVRFDLTYAEPRTGVMLCKLVRQYTGEWEMTALGEFADAKSAKGMVKPAAALL
ncbi:TerD family protein [Actinocorallia longicatena]|uniref:TerD family protein n=1 Tax=Actinocorallia longicatena TaxID=111803 RepID=A0ABP6Q9H1_9ACTN